MEKITIEQIYETHLENKPKRYREFFKEIDMGLETEAYIKWKIEKKNLELVKSIPIEKRKLVFQYLKKGNTVGNTAKHFKIEDSLAVFYLLHYNIHQYDMLNEVSI